MSKRTAASAVLLLALLVASAAGVVGQTTPTTQTGNPSGFDEAAASRLLGQLRNGLVGNSAPDFLRAFDLSSMKDGAGFRQQINSFFAQSESIRIYFKLTHATQTDQEGAAEVEAELEAAPRNSDGPSIHKKSQLHFTARSTGGSWKFVEVRPRGFFSLSPQ